VVRGHTLLIALCAFALVKGTLWAGAIPLWQNPDEPAHFAYVEQLAHQWGLSLDESGLSEGLVASERIVDRRDISHRPEYRGTFDDAARAEREAELAAIRGDARVPHPGGEPIVPVDYPPLYYWLSAQVYRLASPFTYLDVIFALRLFSVALSVVGLVFQFWTFRLIFPDRPRQLLTVLLLTLMPMYTYMQSAINAEVLVTVLFSAFIYLAVKSIREGLDVRRSALIGLVVGLGLLTKQSFLPAVPMFGVLLGIMLFRGRITVRQTVAYGALFASILLVLDGWWYLVRSGAVSPAYHDQPVQPLGLASFLDYVRAYYTRYDWIFDSYWGYFGWLDAPLDQRTFDLIRALSAVSLAGLVGHLAVRAVRWRVDPAVVFMVLGGLGFLVFYILLEYIRIRSGEGAFMQGRYMFPVVTIIVALQVIGLSAFLPRTLQQRGLLAVLIPAVAALHVLALSQFVLPRYYL
jgi:4-amino-4-deoxy-L-arabinose transferase-like glycosyltransferase